MRKVKQSTPVLMITGANHGLGLGYVKALLNNEHSIEGLSDDCYIVAAIHSQEEGSEIACLEEKHQDRLFTIPLEIDKKESIDQFIHSFVEMGFNRIDVLINNAGIFFPEDRALDTLDPDRYHITHATNTVGPILLTQSLLHILNHTHTMKGGSLNVQYKPRDSMKDSTTDDCTFVRIIFMSSSLSSMGDERDRYGPAYSSSKAALNMLVAMFAQKHPQFAVMLLHPGWVESGVGGPNAPLSVEDSIPGCIEMINKHAYMSQSVNKLWSYDGKSIPW